MHDEGEVVLERPSVGAFPNEAVLTALYEAHRGEIFAFLIRMTRDPDAAEDVLQETFIRLIREARGGRMPEAPRAWLYRVASNEAISRSRRSSRLARLIPRLVDRREPARPEADVLRSEGEADLRVALARLRPEARTALLLASQGFTGREIAASIGRTEGATRTLLCRSRVQLRLALDVVEAGR
jgi:RNA polymerase sigma-70 factor (ECF subfamily)